MRPSERLHDKAVGRWRGILMHIGISADYLTGKHTSCPICRDGKDRFRFADEKGFGSWYCNQCGDGSKSGYGGTGADLVMRFLKCDFAAAAKHIAPFIDVAPVVMPKAGDKSQSYERAMGLWRGSSPLSGTDPASLYLARRGIVLDEYPTQLRWVGSAPYSHDAKRRTFHPAMLALFVGPDRASKTLHVTYLTEDGHKADLEHVRKLAACSVPRGGAVRLAPSGETLGVAEGIETALSAMMLHGVPVWATLTAGAMVKFEPPPSVRNVIVFGDHDKTFTGQSAAYGLAHRLQVEGKASGRKIDVRIPSDDYSGPKGADWNDVLMAERHPA